MKQIVIGDIVSRAWDLAVKHWPIFVLLSLINYLFSGVGMKFDETILTGIGQNPDPQVIAEAMQEAITVSPWIIVGILLSTYLGFVIYRMLYNAITTGKPYESLGDALKIDLVQFAVFFCVTLVFGLAVGLGTCLCILPGIFIGVRLIFAPIIVAVENASFGEAFSRSWEMTKGNFWSLLLLGLTAIGIEILGLCACCVGVIFADVVVQFMLMVAYTTLKEDDQSQVGAYTSDYTEVQ